VETVGNERWEGIIKGVRFLRTNLRAVNECLEIDMSNTKKNIWLNVWSMLIFGIFLFGIFIFLFGDYFYPSKQSINRLPSPMVHFVSKKFNFSIDHPESWRAFETPQGNHGDLDVIGMVYVPRNPTTFEIASRNFDREGIDNVVQWGLDRAKRCQEFKQIDRKSYHILGFEGVRSEYTCSKTLGSVKCIDYYFIKGSTGYALSSCATKDQWDEVGPIFDQMIRSFSLE
jgi:hypothetical protein